MTHNIVFFEPPVVLASPPSDCKSALRPASSFIIVSLPFHVDDRDDVMALETILQLLLALKRHYLDFFDDNNITPDPPVPQSPLHAPPLDSDLESTASSLLFPGF